MSCFLFWFIINKVAVNICVWVFHVNKFPFFWSKCLRVQMIDHIIITCFVFLIIFLLLTLLQCSPFSPPLLPSTQTPPPPPSGPHPIVVCVTGLCIYIIWLFSSLFASHPPHPPPLWYLSVCTFTQWNTT